MRGFIYALQYTCRLQNAPISSGSVARIFAPKLRERGMARARARHKGTDNGAWSDDREEVHVRPPTPSCTPQQYFVHTHTRVVQNILALPAIRIRFASEPDLPRVSSRPTLTPLSVTVAERLIAKTEGCC